MSLRLGDTAPDFAAVTTEGPITFHEWIGSGWAADIKETQGHGPNFPIIADSDRKVAGLYEMIHPAPDEVYTVRTVFVIDPKKKIRLMITYPQTTGHNFDEILRVIDSLQLTDAPAWRRRSTGSTARTSSSSRR